MEGFIQAVPERIFAVSSGVLVRQFHTTYGRSLELYTCVSLALSCMTPYNCT